MIASIIDLHIFMLCLLTVMFVYIGKGSKNNISGHIFQVIILCLSFTLLTEAFAWALVVLGHPAAFWVLSLSVASSSLQTIAWISYFDYKVYGDLQGIKRRLPFYMLVPILIALLTLVNGFVPGLIFDIQDKAIIWGTGSILPPVIVYILIIIVLIYLFRNKEMIFGRLTYTLLLFIMLPVLGSLIQFFAVDVPVNWAMYSLALVITFILVELTELHKDELTNLPTRRQFENRLKFKLKNKDAFGIMMIDLNDFKKINDTKGHQEGDIVLQQVADILVTSINPEDMACRVGGDEFTVIVESSDVQVTEMVKARIEKRMDELNQMRQELEIGLSIGLRMVSLPAEWDYNVLLTDIDRKMYRDKADRKKNQK